MGNLARVTRPMRDSDPRGEIDPRDASDPSAPARNVGDPRDASGAPGPSNANSSTGHSHDAGESRGAGDPHDVGKPRVGASPRDSDNTPRMLSPSRYLAWLYSPAAQQPVLAKLCEIESEIAGSLRPGIDHHVAHARLQWWQEECERSAQGRPVHPLTRDLVKAYGAAAARQPSPLAGLSGFVDTAIWDLAGATFETRKELTAYCERWAAAMFESSAAHSVTTVSGAQATVAGELQPAEAAHATRAMQAARMMLASDAPGDTAANTSGNTASDATGGAARATSRWRVLGAAVREIELLADLAREAHAGRMRIPLDELDRAGVEVGSLAKPPWPDPLVTLLRERHEALRATVGESIAALGREEQAGFRGLLVWAALAWRQSARAQRALPGIILPRRYHALADGWQAWRAARQAAAGKLQLS
jgi:phytoene/squalene synthetase